MDNFITDAIWRGIRWIGNIIWMFFTVIGKTVKNGYIMATSFFAFTWWAAGIAKQQLYEFAMQWGDMAEYIQELQPHLQSGLQHMAQGSIGASFAFANTFFPIEEVITCAIIYLCIKVWSIPAVILTKLVRWVLEIIPG